MEDRSELIDDDNCTILELLDRLLNKGVVLAGDIAISVADIDLIYLRAQLLLSSFETARQAGCLWTPNNSKTRTALENT
jgi:gas vesicle structural protein